MVKLSPTVEEIEDLRQADLKGPVVIVHLLKFRADGGRAIYQRYLDVAKQAVDDVEAKGAPALKRLYSGLAGRDVADDQDWDRVSLVEYSNFAHFADVMLHPVYRTEALPLREEALQKAVFMMSFPADISHI